MPKLPVETLNDDEQETLESGKSKEQDDKEQEDHPPEEPMKQDRDQAGNFDDKA